MALRKNKKNSGRKRGGSTKVPKNRRDQDDDDFDFDEDDDGFDFDDDDEEDDVFTSLDEGEDFTLSSRPVGTHDDFEGVNIEEDILDLDDDDFDFDDDDDDDDDDEPISRGKGKKKRGGSTKAKKKSSSGGNRGVIIGIAALAVIGILGALVYSMIGGQDGGTEQPPQVDEAVEAQQVSGDGVEVETEEGVEEAESTDGATDDVTEEGSESEASDGAEETAVAEETVGTEEEAPKKIEGQKEGIQVQEQLGVQYEGNENALPSNGTGAILAFDYAYYTERSGENAMKFFNPNVKSYDAAFVQSYIDKVPSGTTYKLLITPKQLGASYDVILELAVPGQDVKQYRQSFETMKDPDTNMFYVKNFVTEQD